MSLVGRNRTSLLTSLESTPAQQSLYVLILLDIIFCGINTYSVVEAALKTDDFNFFIFRTYRISAPKPRRMNTYKKSRGVGVRP